MKKIVLFSALVPIFFKVSIAQIKQANSSLHSTFPQNTINSRIRKAFKSSENKSIIDQALKPVETRSAYSVIRKMDEVKSLNLQHYTYSNTAKALDTVYVGEVPNDTMRITGIYNHTGPIFVFNDGVLIIHAANLINYGDVYVFGTGKVFADSSYLTFPQLYFYQRSFIVVQHGVASFNNCAFNYSGVSHNLVIGDSGSVTMNSVHENDWTTAGLFGNASIHINDLNLGGEYILSDNSNASFNHVDTLLLWHHLPSASVINYSFPQGDTVPHYVFNNTVNGVNGVNYNVNADTCFHVWWGLMPVNGSNVTISNSNLRTVGEWFQYGDTASLTSLYNNTFYPNVIVPFTDRTMHLLNCFVQTWSLYVFDTSQLSIQSSTLGEVGTQKHSTVLSSYFTLDGSGGYFWATDTSVVFATNTNVYSTVRSEKNGIFVLSYSTVPFASPCSIGSSLVVSVQNNLAYDPVPYDGAIAWMENIELAAVAHVDSVIPIRGSAWIDQGPNGSWMDFSSYSLCYKLLADSIWTPIVTDSLSEIRHNVLGTWNTHGLVAGTYVLRLVVKNSLADSVEDFIGVILVALVTNVNELGNILTATFYPNPVNATGTIETYQSKPSSVKIILMDIVGKELEVIAQTFVHEGIHKFNMNTTKYANGIYFYKIITNETTLTKQLVVKH